MTSGVEVDDTDLLRTVAQFNAGINAAVERVGRDEAARTAQQIRGQVPKRSGRLAGTVRPVGTTVTYGGGLPYARYIEKRSHAVADGVDAAGPRYQRAMQAAADQEARRI